MQSRLLSPLLAGLAVLLLAAPASAAPRVFVFTDINIDAGDPDDRQSLVHLLWYADQLQIEGIVPDRWNAGGYEACQLALDAYDADYQRYDFQQKGYPAPNAVRSRVATDRDDAFARFQTAANDASPEDPLHVLVWGNMVHATPALQSVPERVNSLRLITIGTGLMRESDIAYLPADWERSPPCQQLNWNGAGRQALYQDPRFHQLWWLEINWTYNGMFAGPEPERLFHRLSQFGALGQHLVDVTDSHPWARYFRVGDTPSVLYLIDPDHPRDDPTVSSWAGRFARPFPEQRPNYYTDASGDIDWNYADPCRTWENAEAVFAYSKATLEAERPEMYRALLEKLHRSYDRP